MSLHSVSVMWAAVAVGVGNHLWQSTVFACVVGLLTVILRKNQARTRYWLWLAASVKFLIPFSLLVSMGSHWAWRHVQTESKTGVYVAMEQMGLPFGDLIALQPTMLSPASTVAERGAEWSALKSFEHSMPAGLLVVWLFGSVVVLYRWWTRWRRVASVVREAEPLSTGREVEMLRRLERIETGGLRRRIEMVASRKPMEPGVFGIVRPVLVWPERISDRLNEAHLEAVLAHEILHVRRRDNLSAAIHMVVEATFWFHPMVWWLGTRLVEERERACDEEVLRLCNRPQVYAESILKVCEFCVESPLACVSGVTGSDLKKRIVHIMTEHVARKLTFARKLLLVVAGSSAIIVPVMVGAMNAPVSEAQERGADATVEVIKAMVSPARAIEMKALPMLAVVEPVEAPAWQTAAPPSTPVPSQTGAAATPTNPQDLTGTWQGTLQTDKTLRIIVKMSKASGGWQTGMYSIDEGPGARGTGLTVLQGSNVKYLITENGGVFEGKLSADGASITGTWTMNAKTLPLTFIRATKETAWEIPAPPPPPKLMAADADPSFDVVTIKPNDSGATSMQGLNVRGRNFTTRASSLDDLIKFAYGVHARQIVGGPEWIDKDRYDINGVPDKDGMPSVLQLQAMMKKLLADRFKLTFHHEKRDLSAFVLTVAKDGQKLTPTKLDGPLPGLGFRPAPGGITLGVVNGTMGDFTDFLQMLVLDRPVVDRTGITGRYDFHFAFTPDDSLFNGHPPRMPAQADSTADAAPGFFEAIQKDIGLKLDAQKTAVDVLVIDHVQKPSEN